MSNTEASRGASPGDNEAADQDVLQELIEGELKLLAAYDARQASADARTRATATAALALPTLTLSLAKSFATNESALNWIYGGVVIASIVVLVLALWNWQRPGRKEGATKQQRNELGPRWKLSAESEAAKQARRLWRACYDPEGKAAIGADTVTVRRRALEMWRTRAVDSHHIAQLKEAASAGATLALILALTGSAVLVIVADL
jgi:hypothetical protein